ARRKPFPRAQRRLEPYLLSQSRRRLLSRSSRRACFALFLRARKSLLLRRVEAHPVSAENPDSCCPLPESAFVAPACNRGREREAPCLLAANSQRAGIHRCRLRRF